MAINVAMPSSPMGNVHELGRYQKDALPRLYVYVNSRLTPSPPPLPPLPAPLSWPPQFYVYPSKTVILHDT